jgi:hypothetical protein
MIRAIVLLIALSGAATSVRAAPFAGTSEADLKAAAYSYDVYDRVEAASEAAEARLESERAREEARHEAIEGRFETQQANIEADRDRWRGWREDQQKRMQRLRGVAS